MKNTPTVQPLSKRCFDIDFQRRAENLFIEAERLGLDAPTQPMLADSLAETVSETIQDVCVWLAQNGYENVSKGLEEARQRHMLDTGSIG